MRIVGCAEKAGAWRITEQIGVSVLMRPSSRRGLPRRGDEIFEDAVFTSLYDYFNTWDACDEFYLSLARECGGPVLDLGCGTGMLACRIGREGLEVVGVDPAEGMLRVARSRDGAERVSWIKAHGQTLRLSMRFNLIYMTGHAFQALLSDEDAVAVLRTVNDHLSETGTFAFETRNPARRPWLSWTPSNRRVAKTAEHGRIEQFHKVVVQEGGIVDIAHHYHFVDSDKTVVGSSRLRFIDQHHLMRLLDTAKLVPTACYGNWDRSPLTETSREFIVVARRAYPACPT